MGARFGLGDCRATVGAMEALAAVGGDWRFNAAPYLARHQDGDWGEIDEHDRTVNEAALQTGARLLSAYTVGEQRIWLITEAGRTQTTILLPEEY